MKKLFTLLFATSFIGASAYANSACELDELKVRYSYSNKNKQETYIVGNIKESFWLSPSESSVIRLLEKSKNNPKVALKIELNEASCENLKYISGRYTGSAHYINGIKSIRETSVKLDSDCIDCEILTGAPIAFQFPTMTSLDEILSNGMYLSPYQVEQLKINIFRMLKSMNFQTPQANSIIFFTSLAELFFELEVPRITSQNLEDIAEILGQEVSQEEKKFISALARQVDVIELSYDRKNNKNITLKSANRKAIILEAKDMPAKTEEERQLIEENFSYLKIDHNTLITFVPRKKGEVTRVSLEGIEVRAVLPVIGKTIIRPDRFDIELDAKAPVKAKINFKKGITIPTFFSIDF